MVIIQHEINNEYEYELLSLFVILFRGWIWFVSNIVGSLLRIYDRHVGSARVCALCGSVCICPECHGDKYNGAINTT